MLLLEKTYFKMGSISDTTAPVKTVQLEGKIIAITGANRGM